MSTTAKPAMMPTVGNYFVCSAFSEHLNEAARQLEEHVESFLSIGCQLHGPTVILMQPEIPAGFFRSYQPRRFWLSQTIVRKKITG